MRDDDFHCIIQNGVFDDASDIQECRFECPLGQHFHADEGVSLRHVQNPEFLVVEACELVMQEEGCV